MEDIISNEKTETIKLTKNAKGYMQYEIKVSSEQLNDDTLKRLKYVRDKLEEEYGEK